MDYQGLLDLVQKRRTIRKFKPDPVPDDYVDKMIEVARWAPSGANSQPWDFIVVKQQETRARICSFLHNLADLSSRMELVRSPEMRFNENRNPGYAVAPVFIVVCGDTRTKEAYPLIGTMERGSSIFDSSLANAFLYLTMAATTLGLASQWVTSIANSYVQTLTKETLAIPQPIEIYNMLAVGYPDFTPKPRLVRARPEITHVERYDQALYRSDQSVRDFIARIRAR